MSAFSNNDKNVFIIKTPRQVDRGALMARYSRSPKGMRQIYEDEFTTNDERGKEFYQRVLIEYGDDSVAELGETQLAVENISNIAAQFIEDSRIGLSYLEKSSRYVIMDKFYTPNLDQYTDIYNEQCQHSINTYSKISEDINKYLREIYPEESLDYGNAKNPKFIYNNTIKGKTLDITRGLLPVSVFTNIGICGNARAFEYLLVKMKSSPILEIQALADDIYKELNTIIEPFLTRVNTNYGKQYSDYLRTIRSRSNEMLYKHISEIQELPAQKLAEKELQRNPSYYSNHVKCIDSDVQLISEVNILCELLFEQCEKNISIENIRQWLLPLSINQRRKMLHQIMQNTRGNRRHRLPRAFENSMWRFEIVSSYAIYRDLHRHRMLTFHRPIFNPNLGYYIPDEIVEISKVKDFMEVLEGSKNTYDIIHQKYPQEAQYLLNFAFNYRYQIYANFRELCHIIELRTIPQGSPEYRLICQKIYKEIRDKGGKFLSQFINFVDLNDYPLERLKSEIRKDIKVNG